MASLSVCALLLALVAVMAGLSGCNVADKAKDMKDEIEKEWQAIGHSPEIQKVVGHARETIQKAQNATRAGGAAVEKKAEELVKAAIHDLYVKWKAAMKPVDSYVIPPKCLLAMAVGGGAVAAASGLGLAALGFASEGVEAGSLAALWQSALGDVEEGSLFARLQSLGAKGLSTAQNFRVSGVVASISACMCGVVDDLCQHCISTAQQARPKREAEKTDEAEQPLEARSNMSMAIIIQSMNQSYQLKQTNEWNQSSLVIV
eukprot:gnl/TRDRNA2_/TRDRNA2_93229_c0_seq1.p1 gnl/TRDRNA2_/TRDRNA2_93229_c0~~gnl/TRDRNA2_/TRDRNA2_93229_c0_seq1.p1  ORF type:complete len:260 (-),score=55.26 gnl/TRDRNA2_/TRDRNA2_93229_c0_seq1:469-1248(-)